MYSYTNTRSSNSTTHHHLSPHRQCNSQSDLFDPIYSVIQYPLNDTRQSIHSSTSSWNHSSMSIHQPYTKDSLLVKSIWTSQDSIVSDVHVYCELINMKSDKSHCYIEKKINSELNYNEVSCCTLCSYVNSSYQNMISNNHSIHSTNMKQCNTPPKLPLRNYGESTLNMVENVRLRTLRNKQKHIRNRYRLSKLHKHVHSMFDVTWRLDNRQNVQEYSEQSSLKTFYQYYKQKYFKKRNFIETLNDYDELIPKHSTDHKTRSILSEFPTGISLDHVNSPEIQDHLRGNDQDQQDQIVSTDISELSPSRTKSPRSIRLKQNNSTNSYLTSPSFNPLYHIYIPNYSNRIKDKQAKESNKILNQTFNQNTTNNTPVSKTILPDDNHYFSLRMPPLMERSMEDDDCYLCR
ncbi:hypothetical protein KSF78_0009508 [Schistosoma japonicum]|nr:hypothetical protein KSF78_0009508 [Schistosoma japonicum]